MTKIYAIVQLLFAVVTSYKSNLRQRIMHAENLTVHKRLATGRDCKNGDYAGWMTNYKDFKIKQLTLLGSHDAGSIEEYNGNSWAVCQSVDVFEQLCGGYRVFDIRLRKDGSVWKINHSAFLFQEMKDVAADIRLFCHNHPTEVIVLRIKMTKGTMLERIAQVVKFRDALNQGGKTCVVEGDADIEQTFTEWDLKTILAKTHPKVGAIIFMTYYNKDAGTLGLGLDAEDEKQEIVDLDLDNLDEDGYNKKKVVDQNFGQWKNTWDTYKKIAFEYKKNQFGKYSEQVKITQGKWGFWGDGVVKGQEKKVEEGKTAIANGKTFGFWMTSTGTAGAMNVKANSQKLFDTVPVKKDDNNEGKYSGWLYAVIEHFTNLQGWTIWVDFANKPAGTDGQGGTQTYGKTVTLLNEYVLKPTSDRPKTFLQFLDANMTKGNNKMFLRFVSGKTGMATLKKEVKW